MKTYGYARVSTAKQSIQRQIDNIKAYCETACIFEEKYTGTTMDRPAWQRLMKKVKAGDTIIFDEVSRMSRTAEEGFQTYIDLQNKGVELVFLKEHHIDTAVYRESAAGLISMTETDVDLILQGVNRFLQKLAENQIRIAFESSQAEVDHLHQRTSEGVQRAIAEGKQVGRVEGQKVTTQKEKACREQIRKMSKDFEGSMSDPEIISILGIARGSYYKYKKAIKEADEQ